jgi:6-phosphogluconolactonase
MRWPRRSRRAAQATLAVSGGSTPKRFFEALSHQPIDWEPGRDHPDRRAPGAGRIIERSNHRLAREHLLKHLAAKSPLRAAL